LSTGAARHGRAALPSTVAASISLPATLLLILAVLGILAVRDWPGLTHPQFVFEEAGAFWTGAVTQWPALFVPWGGFLHVGARLVFAVAALGPAELAPTATILLHWALIAGIVALVASDRLADAIPDRRDRVGFALVLPFLGSDAILTALSSHLWLGLLLVLVALARPSRWDVPLVLVAGLTGPISVIVWPLYRRPLGFLVAACGAVQVGVLLLSGRESAPLDPGAFAMRALPLIVLAALAIYRTPLPRRTVVSFAWLGLAMAAGGGLSLGDAFATPLLDTMVGPGARHVLAATAAIALFAVAGVLARRPLAILVAGVMVALIAHGFLQVPVGFVDWAAEAHCVGGPKTLSRRCRASVLVVRLESPVRGSNQAMGAGAQGLDFRDPLERVRRPCAAN
jgi:hypothetical protein